MVSALRSQLAALSPETMSEVEDAVPKYPVPETVMAVEEAYGSVFALVAIEVMAPDKETVEVAVMVPPTYRLPER